jgi:hypothetical protein
MREISMRPIAKALMSSSAGPHALRRSVMSARNGAGNSWAEWRDKLTANHVLELFEEHLFGRSELIEAEASRL